MKKVIVCVSVFVSIMAVATVVRAGYITPTGVTVTGDIVDAGDPSALISDATGTDYIQTNPGESSLGDLWEGTTVSDRAAAFSNPAHAIVTFDLGNAYDVTTLYAWRYNRSGNGSNGYPNAFASANIFSLLGSADGSTFNLIANIAGIDGLGYGSADTEPVQTRVLASLSGGNVDNAKGIRFVRMDISAAYNGWLGDSFSHTIGLGEVAFAGTAVPEPATTGMLVTALSGLVAYAWRKRR